MTLPLFTAAVGVVLLVGLLVATLVPLRRFTRATAELRRGLTPRAQALQALVPRRVRPGR